MGIESVVDFVNQAHEEIGKFSIEITLSPAKLMADEYCVEVLTWSSVKYGEAEANDVPNDRRGVYAFVVSHENSVLPPNGCVLYIGIAGRDSDRSLRERYKDYLNERKILKRERIARMIGTWHEVLRFYFSPVGAETTAEDLKPLEKQLNTALLPKFSEGDLDAATKRKRRAFR